MNLSIKNTLYFIAICFFLPACNNEAKEDTLKKIDGEWSVEYFFRNTADKTTSMDDSKIIIDTKNMSLTTNVLAGEEEEIITIATEKELRYQSIFKGKVKLIEGLADFLNEAKKNNIPMAIGTAAPEINVNFFFEEMPIRSLFKEVVHSGMVEKGKPNPEVFLKCADAIGIAPKDCLVFEDSVSGAETAKNAGCKAIIITTTHKAEEFAHLDNIIGFVDNYTALDYTTLFS